MRAIEARAHWLARDIVAAEAAADALVWEGGELALEPLPQLPEPLRERWPHLRDRRAFRVVGFDPEALYWPLRVRGEQETGVQVAGVLDDLYATDTALGAVWEGGVATVRVWAPTARRVRLELDGALHDMRRDAYGVWSAQARGGTYRYEVEVYGERHLVTDPYSVALTPNSQRSVLTELADHAPPGWDALIKPPERPPAVYELHVRDFSINDPTVPAELRGTYGAFGADSDGMRHLRALARAGITHVHLLPVFDFATVDEDRSTWRDPGDLSGFAPDAVDQQERVTAIADRDGFNWGYDPWHYTVPEGSYARADRILEFRAMVAALARAGLCVVMDVVYNHTHAHGNDPRAVLDRIVPGYYHRRLDDGTVATSTCCSNTATEHAMMEKLMLDSLRTWAREYKVDGFRFDLMGFHSRETMLRVRRELGPGALLYGEGWEFGEIAGDARFVAATRRNMEGTDILTFDDGLRDAARRRGSDDAIRRGLAGGAVSYVEAHDDETLWDILAERLPRRTPLAARVRAHVVALSYVAFSRGLPFFHAGGELLRSKSGDRDSYNSGDWFNRIFWDGSDNNWGAGLPPRAKNEHRWARLAPLLADPALKPGPAEIAWARERFFELLAIRRYLTGPVHFGDTEPGMIVMHVGKHVIAFNAGARRRTHPLAPARLHGVQARSGDAVVRRARVRDGLLSVPGRTTAVFVLDTSGGLNSSSSGYDSRR